MKKIKILGILLLAIVGLNSCDTTDDFVFTAQEPQSLGFTNSFLEEYTLTPTTANNLGERFTWNNADFGVPTVVTYELEKSISGDFTDVESVGETNGNEMAVTIGQLLSYAQEAGLDNDPNSENPDTGMVYFRLKATVGIDALPVYSDAQALTLFLPEESTGGGSGVSLSTWGVVGSGYNNWGAFTDSPFYTTSTSGILVAYVTLVNGEIKFRENNDWTNNYGDTGADGTLDAGGDNIAVTAGTYKITLNLNDNTYTKEPFSWGVVGSGYNDWGATPDAKFYYDYTTDTFKVGVRLIDGEIKFRFNNAWDTNFGDTGADGTLDAGGDNIAVTSGHYVISLDINNGTFTMEAGDVWGVVGSGYNDWGATPDFSLTEVNPGIVVGDVVTLIDGEIKFRVSNDWGFNYGDSGADGTLDQDGDNIVVTAGDYRVMLNLNDGTYQVNKIQ